MKQLSVSISFPHGFIGTSDSIISTSHSQSRVIGRTASASLLVQSRRFTTSAMRYKDNASKATPTPAASASAVPPPPSTPSARLPFSLPTSGLGFGAAATSASPNPLFKTVLPGATPAAGTAATPFGGFSSAASSSSATPASGAKPAAPFGFALPGAAGAAAAAQQSPAGIFGGKLPGLSGATPTSFGGAGSFLDRMKNNPTAFSFNPAGQQAAAPTAATPAAPGKLSPIPSIKPPPTAAAGASIFQQSMAAAAAAPRSSPSQFQAILDRAQAVKQHVNMQGDANDEMQAAQTRDAFDALYKGDHVQRNFEQRILNRKQHGVGPSTQMVPPLGMAQARGDLNIFTPTNAVATGFTLTPLIRRLTPQEQINERVKKLADDRAAEFGAEYAKMTSQQQAAFDKAEKTQQEKDFREQTALQPEVERQERVYLRRRVDKALQGVDKVIAAELLKQFQIGKLQAEEVIAKAKIMREEGATMFDATSRPAAEDSKAAPAARVIKAETAPAAGFDGARSETAVPLFLESIEQRVKYMQQNLEKSFSDQMKLFKMDQTFRDKYSQFERQAQQIAASHPHSAQALQAANLASQFKAHHAKRRTQLEESIRTVQSELSFMEQSLELTSKFADSRNSQVEDGTQPTDNDKKPASGEKDAKPLKRHATSGKVILLDNQPFQLSPESAEYLHDAEHHILEECAIMARRDATLTPSKWWQLLSSQMHNEMEEQKATLLEEVARDEAADSQDQDLDDLESRSFEEVVAQHLPGNKRKSQTDEEDDEEETEQDTRKKAAEEELEEAMEEIDEDLDEEYEPEEQDENTIGNFSLYSSKPSRLQKRVELPEFDDEHENEQIADQLDLDDPDDEWYQESAQRVHAKIQRQRAIENHKAVSLTGFADKVETKARINEHREESFFEKRSREIEVTTIQTLNTLSDAMGIPVKTLTKKLHELDLSTAKGSQAVLREDVARLLVEEFDFVPVKREQVIQPQTIASLRKKALKTEEYLALPYRPPVITVMGHVDHGKTTLLDRLRSENRAAGEAGGITQAIGAFRVNLAPKEEGEEQSEVDSEGKPLYATFLDTPGHAAFKSMRAKGCNTNCTDLVILVISAADGLQPQSLEVIQLARQNNVPLIIAVNKIDVTGADPQEILKQLQVHDVVVESMGGEILSCNISAKTGEGIGELKDLIRLTSEILQLHADRSCPGEAYVIESRILKNGCVANVLVRNGTVKVGDYFVCGLQYGRIRSLHDEKDKSVNTPIYPGQAAQLIGFKSLDDITEDLYIVPTEEMAMKIVEERSDLMSIDEGELVGSVQDQNQKDQKAQAYKIQVTRRKKRVAIRPLTEDEQAAKTLQDAAVPFLVKSDVSGSMEVLLDYFAKLPREEVISSIIKSGLGDITVADVEHAANIGEAIIVGFNVKPTSDAVLLAKQKGITIYHHPVIYSLWDDIQGVLSAKLPAEFEELELGQATVQQLFPLSGGGKKKQKADQQKADQDADAAEAQAMVAGCRVKSGKLDAKMKYKILRDEEIIFDGTCVSLRVGKDVKQAVEKGNECGIRLSHGSDALVQAGDVIQCYTMTKKKRMLDDSAARGFTGSGDLNSQLGEFYSN